MSNPANIPYRKIIRTRASFSDTSLYEGPDHYLYVQTNGAGQRYRRFNFKDISAFAIVQTNEWIWILLLCFSIAGLMIWGALSSGDASIWAAFSIPIAIVVISTIVYLIKGPTCRTVLYTAASEVPIRCLNRRKTTLRILHQMDQTIRAAQPSIPAAPDGDAAGPDELDQDVPPPASPALSPMSSDPELDL